MNLKSKIITVKILSIILMFLFNKSVFAQQSFENEFNRNSSVGFQQNLDPFSSQDEVVINSELKSLLDENKNNLKDNINKNYKIQTSLEKNYSVRAGEKLYFKATNVLKINLN